MKSGKNGFCHLILKHRSRIQVVVKIDGDYAHLKRTDIPSDDLKLVARALLPADINEGSRLKYEMFQYELIG